MKYIPKCYYCVNLKSILDIFKFSTDYTLAIRCGCIRESYLIVVNRGYRL